MPSEPRWVAARDSVVEDLGLMSRANGYWYDYAEVTSGTASFADEPDYAVPSPFYEWLGTIEERVGLGDESATTRCRHNEGFLITFSIKSLDGDHERMAARVRMDVHTALMGSTRRNRGMARVNTFDVSTAWSAGDEGGKQGGGILALTYVVRIDHTTGDMATQ